MSNLRYYEALRAEIVRLLKEARVQRKLSNYAVWQRSGVSQTMLGHIERGLRNPSLELLLRIADAIEADLPALMTKARVNVSKSGLSSAKDREKQPRLRKDR